MMKKNDDPLKVFMNVSDNRAEQAKAASEAFALYKSYVDAGFTTDQAMQLLCVMLQAVVTRAGSNR